MANPWTTTQSVISRIDAFGRGFGYAAICALLSGCGAQQAAESPSMAPAEPLPKPTAEASPAPQATADKQVATSLPPAVVLANAGFKTPESVLYDPEEDVYLVSNIQGGPTDADLNGFISKVSPSGEVVALKFIDGAKPGSWLNAPKGMGISGDTLYVTDITFVRLFDRKTGEPKGKIGVGGATFVNDISVAPDGTIYVSDTGWRAGAKGLENSRTDAIYTIDPKSVAAKELIKDPKLGNPNGLSADDQGVWVASSAGDLYRVNKQGEISSSQQLPGKGLDGLVALPDSSFLVSSWEAKSIFKGRPGGSFEPILQNITSPADIGFDSKRNRVLIPVFEKNSVRIQDLSRAGTVTEPAPPPAVPAQPAPSAVQSAKPQAPKPAAAAAPKPAAAAAPKPASAAAAPKPAAAAAPKPASAAAAPKPTTPQSPKPAGSSATVK